MPFPFPHDRLRLTQQLSSWLENRLVFKGASPDTFVSRKTEELLTKEKGSLIEAFKSVTGEVTEKRVGEIVQGRITAVKKKLDHLINASSGDAEAESQYGKIKSKLIAQLKTIEEDLKTEFGRLLGTKLITKLEREHLKKYKGFVNKYLAPAAASLPQYVVNKTFKSNVQLKLKELAGTWAGKPAEGGKPSVPGESWTHGIGGELTHFSQSLFRKLYLSFENNSLKHRGGAYSGSAAAYVFLADKIGGPKSINNLSKDEKETALKAAAPWKKMVQDAFAAYYAYSRMRRDADQRAARAGLFPPDQKGLHVLLRRGANPTEKEKGYIRLTKEFFGGLTFNAKGEVSHSNASLQTLITRHSSAEREKRTIAAVRKRSTEIQTEGGPVPEPLQQRDVSLKVGNSLLKRPEIADLASFVKTGNYLVEGGFRRGRDPLTGKVRVPLTWENVYSARVVSDRSGRYLTLGGIKYTLNVKTIPTGETYVNADGETKDIVKDRVIVTAPKKYEVDLYSFVMALKRIRKDYGPGSANRFRGKINIADTVAFLDLESTRYESGKSYYRQLLSNSRLPNKTIKSSIKLKTVLNRLLPIKLRQKTQTPAQWEQAINAIRLGPTVSPDEFSTLFAIKFLVKARTVSGGAMNIEGFTRALLTSRNFRRIPTPNTLTVKKHIMTEYLLYKMYNRTPGDLKDLYGTRMDKRNFSYEAQNALKHAPGFKEIIKFFNNPKVFDFNLYDSNKKPVRNLLTGNWDTAQPVWKKLLLQYDLRRKSEPSFVSEGEVLHGIGAPTLFIKRETIAEYKRLQENNPYFRMITSIPGASAPKHTLSSMTAYFLMPMVRLQ